MFNAQVPALQAEVNRLKQTAPKPASEPPAAPAKPTPDAKDIEAFGAEMVEMAVRYAQKAVEMSEARLDTRIRALEDKVNGVGQQAEVVREQQFFAVLAELVPDWEAINADDRWLMWLNEIDAFSGARRQDLLNHAQQTGEARRAAAIFKAFKDTLPKPRAPEPVTPQVQPASTGAATPVPVAPAAKPILSQKFVQKFFADRDVHQRYRGREAEAAQIEHEINLAAAEGRIV
jgi:hypothetical protein